MVTIIDWFNVTMELEYSRLVGLISYSLILVGTFIFQFSITNKIRSSKVQSDSYRSFRLLYVAVAIIAGTYASDHLGSFLGGSVMHPQFSVFLSIVGYTIAIYALNLFLLRIINFRSSMKRFIRVLTFIQVGLLIFASIVYLLASFIEMPAFFVDYTVMIFGLTVIFATIFTIISMLAEARNTANKMVKLRLRLAALGTLGILLEGAANILHIILGSMELDTEKYYQIGIPLLAILFYAIFMFSYYFSLFPPMWLQQASGVLPPSFTDLMKKQEQLKQLGSATK